MAAAPTWLRPGGSEPAHLHYDVRFLLQSDGEDFVENDESHALRWVGLESVSDLTKEESVLRLVDKTREALEGHFASPHFTGMRDTIAARGIRGLDVEKIRGTLAEPVYDPQGRPRADFFTES